jgi:hypothetical protein
VCIYEVTSTTVRTRSLICAVVFSASSNVEAGPLRLDLWLGERDLFSDRLVCVDPSADLDRLFLEVAGVTGDLDALRLEDGRVGEVARPGQDAPPLRVST